MTKYKYGNPEAPIVLIQPVGDHDLPEIEGEVAQIRKLTALDFQMIAVKVDDWNLDLFRGKHQRYSEMRILARVQPRC